jgi:hypothetical protein
LIVAPGLDLPLFEAGEEVGHRCFHFSYYSGQCLCPEQCFMRQTLFRKGMTADD